MPHLLTSNPSRMVFECLRDCFQLEDSISGFPQLFQLCFHITQGHIPPQIAHVLKATRLLTMTKPSSEVCPIAVRKHYIYSQAMFYVFYSMKLLQHTFPHTNLELQLKVVVKK
jgi:hypothetical protein